jgi:microcystin-dependent protein
MVLIKDNKISSGNSVLNVGSSVVDISHIHHFGILDISMNGGLILPSGTTSEQNSTTNGSFRYNTTTNKVELYSDGSWNNLRPDDGVIILKDYSGSNNITFTAPSGVGKNHAFRINNGLKILLSQIGLGVGSTSGIVDDLEIKGGNLGIHGSLLHVNNTSLNAVQSQTYSSSVSDDFKNGFVFQDSTSSNNYVVFCYNYIQKFSTYPSTILRISEKIELGSPDSRSANLNIDISGMAVGQSHISTYAGDNNILASKMGIGSTTLDTDLLFNVSDRFKVSDTGDISANNIQGSSLVGRNSSTCSKYVNVYYDVDNNNSYVSINKNKPFINFTDITTSSTDYTELFGFEDNTSTINGGFGIQTSTDNSDANNGFETFFKKRLKLFSYNGVTDTLALDISGSQIGIGTLADPNYQLTAPSINANKLSKNRPAGWFGSNNNSSTNTFHTLSHNGDLFFTNGKFKYSFEFLDETTQSRISVSNEDLTFNSPVMLIGDVSLNGSVNTFHEITIDTSVNYQDNLHIDISDSENGPTPLKLNQHGSGNIMELTNSDDEPIFTITNSGAVGIGRTNVRTGAAMDISGNASGAFPAGFTMMYVGDNAPDGWLLCDGSQYSCATYPDLSNALISDGANFNVPDMRMRIPIGSNGDDLTFSNNNYNDISSGTTHIDENHLPTHNHDISTNISFTVDENTYSYQNDSSNVIVDVSFVRSGPNNTQIPYFPFRTSTKEGGQSRGRIQYGADAAFVMKNDYFNTNTDQSGNVVILDNTTNIDLFYPKYTSINFIIKT